MTQSREPGLLGRLKQAISSTLGGAVDAMRDPGHEVALRLDDLAEQVRTSEEDLKRVVVERKVLERKEAELGAEVTRWRERAEQALRLGDEALARSALARSTESAERLAAVRAGATEQRELAERMHAQIREAKAKLAALNLRRGSLVQQARANAQGGGGSIASAAAGAAGARIDAIEAEIARVEAQNEVAQETRSAEALEAELDAKLASLGSEDPVAGDLEALKAKMRAQGVLPPHEDR